MCPPEKLQNRKLQIEHCKIKKIFMSLRSQSTLRIVLYEGDGANTLEPTECFSAMSALLEKGFAVTRTAAQGRVAPADKSSLLVLGKFQDGRAPNGEDATGEVKVRFQDISGFDAEKISQSVEAVRTET